MSSPPATATDGDLQPFPSIESAPAVETTEELVDSVKPLPQDVDAAAAQSAEATLIDEARRRFENSCAPDEELRESLGKMIELCQSLTTRIQTLEPQILDLQTTLTLTQSNLTLSLANTEMLEDALRSNSQSRDVGWRRSDSTARRPVAASMSYPLAAEQAKIVVHAASPVKATSATATPMSPPENRFFKFRFGTKTPSPTSPAYPPPQPAHLTSASLPSLGLSIEDEARAKQIEKIASEQEALKLKAAEIETRNQELVEREKTLNAREEEAERVLNDSKEKQDELEKIRKELEAERKTSQELEKEKSRVQDEIESLTQSLFEEANKMVADERRRAAEVEALLRETEEERDAVRGAMRVVEGENGRLRELSVSRVSEESSKPPAIEPARSTTPPRPGSSHSSHEGDRSIQREDVPAPVNGVESASVSTDMLPDVPPLPASSPDPWKAQPPNALPPQTPPRIHALPTETSPWAEGRA
ncbi:hypothetical protein FRC10_009721 [Ceratobasidium sp. 414]|nr:hypothetical protein FRC10_009721 [Ceratobasidium sp. 414]